MWYHKKLKAAKNIIHLHDKIVIRWLFTHVLTRDIFELLNIEKRLKADIVLEKYLKKE